MQSQRRFIATHRGPPKVGASAFVYLFHRMLETLLPPIEEDRISTLESGAVRSAAMAPCERGISTQVYVYDPRTNAQIRVPVPTKRIGPGV